MLTGYVSSLLPAMSDHHAILNLTCLEKFPTATYLRALVDVMYSRQVGDIDVS
ncbi:MAG: hypothetical protein VCA12_08150 [Pseudomonadales bacterium]|jgi:hypothetical protein